MGTSIKRRQRKPNSPASVIAACWESRVPLLQSLETHTPTAVRQALLMLRPVQNVLSQTLKGELHESFYCTQFSNRLG